MAEQEQRNAAIEAADKIINGEWGGRSQRDGRMLGEIIADFAIQYAAEQVAAERTRIADELNAIGNKETDLHDYAKDIHTYIEQLRGADTGSDKGGR